MNDSAMSRSALRDTFSVRMSVSVNVSVRVNVCVCVRVCVSRCMRSDIFWYFFTHVQQSYKSCERVTSHVYYFTRVLLQTASVANSPTTPLSTHASLHTRCSYSTLRA